jgi:D-alanyl-D-alanine carboxypeptidase
MREFRSNAIPCLALAIFAALFAGQAAVSAQSIDDYVNQQMTQHHIPGMSVSVIKDGKTLVSKGYGLANVELNVPATENTVYQLASVTKQFTATGIMMLVQEGKLGLDDKISAKLSDLPVIWANVTIRQLLTHTSGIKDYTSVSGFDKNVRCDMTKAEVLQLVADAPLDFPSGTKFNYSNTGYFLLGMIIEKVTGKVYGDFLRERIFQPLGMTATQFNDIHTVIKNRASGYMLDGQIIQNADFVSPTQPFAAGSLVSTVVDMAKWDAALDTEKLLPRAALDSMWVPAKLADGTVTTYGFGWGWQLKNGHPIAGHDGGINGFTTSIVRLLADHVTVIVLANLDVSGAGRIAHAIAGLYVPAVADAPVVAIADTTPELTAKQRDFLDRIKGGKAKPEEFTEQAQAFFFPDRIGKFQEFVSALGTIHTFELVEDETKDGVRRRRYRVKGTSGSALIALAVTADGKINGVWVTPE